jgi:hypothetical protein
MIRVYGDRNGALEWQRRILKAKIRVAVRGFKASSRTIPKYQFVPFAIQKLGTESLVQTNTVTVTTKIALPAITKEPQESRQSSF